MMTHIRGAYRPPPPPRDGHPPYNSTPRGATATHLTAHQRQPLNGTLQSAAAHNDAPPLDNPAGTLTTFHGYFFGNLLHELIHYYDDL